MFIYPLKINRQCNNCPPCSLFLATINVKSAKNKTFIRKKNSFRKRTVLNVSVPSQTTRLILIHVPNQNIKRIVLRYMY